MTASNQSPGHSSQVTSSPMSAVETSKCSIPKFRIVQGRGLGERKRTQPANESRTLSVSYGANIRTELELLSSHYQHEVSQFAFPNTQQQHVSYQNPVQDGLFPDARNNRSSCYFYVNAHHRPYDIDDCEHAERRMMSPFSGFPGIVGMHPSLYSHGETGQYNADSSELRHQHMHSRQLHEPICSKQSAQQQIFSNSMNGRLMPMIEERFSPGSYHFNSPRSPYMAGPGSTAQQLYSHRQGFQEVSDWQKQQLSYEISILNGLNTVQPSHSHIYQQQPQNTYPNSNNHIQPANLQSRRSTSLVPLNLSGPPNDAGVNSPLMGLLNSSPPCTIPENERISQCLSFFHSLMFRTRMHVADLSPIQKQNCLDVVRKSIVSVLCADISVDEFVLNISRFMTPDMVNKTIPILRVTIAALRTAVTNGNINTTDLTGNALSSIKSTADSSIEPAASILPEALSYDHDISSTEVGQDSNPIFIESNVQNNIYLPSYSNCATRTEELTKAPIVCSISNTKVEMFADRDALLAKIFEKLPANHDIDDAALELISEAVQEKLREVSTDVINLAAHRLISYRSHEDYTVIDDTKAQLQYIERLERSAWKLQCHNDKNSNSTFSEHHNLREQVKTSRADYIALQALGKSSNVIGDTATTNESQPLNCRPRIIRVTIRDLHLQLASSCHFSRSHTARKIAFGLN